MSINPHVLNLVAFLAVLVAIAVLALSGSGDAAIVTGLVGVLGSFRPWSTSISGAEARPSDSPLEVDVVGTPGSPPKEQETPS